MNEQQQILVIGGKGKTGGRVVQKLQDMGAAVTSASRSTNPTFDWNEPHTWEQVLKDKDSVYITYQPDLAVPGATEAIKAFSAAAAKAGIKKLVLLSGRGEVEAQAAESVVINSGLEWTIIRASWFNQNFSEGSFLEPILAGYVELPAGDVREPFVDADDIADVAVAALTQEGHKGKLYEVTGPRLITFREAVEAIANVTGKPIQYQYITIEDYTAALTAYSLPENIVRLIAYLFTEVLDGRNEHLAHGVEEALGRKPTDFTEYVKKAAAAGAWS